MDQVSAPEVHELFEDEKFYNWYKRKYLTPNPYFRKNLNSKVIGIMFIASKNNNLLSIKLIFVLNLLFKNKNIKKKGINIPICFPKNVSGRKI